MEKKTVSVKKVLPHASPNITYETVLTTKSSNGVVNAAPIGVKFLDEELSCFLLRIYKKSRTYNNLLETRVGVVNITRNPIVFIKYLLRDKKRYLEREIEDALNVDAPKLKDAEAYIEFTVESVHHRINLGEFYCLAVNAYEGVKTAQPYSRAEYALVELSVNISRVEPYLEQGLDLSELLNSIAYCLKVIDKTAAKTVIEDYSRILLSSLSDHSSLLLKRHLSRLGIHLQ